MLDPTRTGAATAGRQALAANSSLTADQDVAAVSVIRGLDLDDLRAFRQWGSATPGHPEAGHTPGIEVTIGALGPSLANAVGMAISQRYLRSVFGADAMDHNAWVIAGDECLTQAGRRRPRATWHQPRQRRLARAGAAIMRRRRRSTSHRILSRAVGGSTGPGTPAGDVRVGPMMLDRPFEQPLATSEDRGTLERRIGAPGRALERGAD